MSLEGSKILVTGGAGFVGRYLVNRLAQQGAQVVVLDKTAPPPEFRHLSTVSYVSGDITNPADLRAVIPGVEYVFHLAALPLGACTKDPRAALDVNVGGTFNVLEVAAQAGVKKVLFASSYSVYGDTAHPVDEGDTLNPKTIYGVSKIASEYLYRYFYEAYKLDYVILRCANVYGTGQKGGIAPIVLKRITQGLPPIIFGDGTQSFDFVYIDDVISATILAMESGVTNDTFNIGSGEEISIKELVLTLLNIAGSKLVPEFRPGEPVVERRKVGSIDKARRILGYQPAVCLRDGFKAVVSDYYRKETVIR